MKCGFYITIGNDQLSGWTGKKSQGSSQSQTCDKKCSWSLFVGLLPIRSTTTFWNLVKPLHLRSVLSQSMSCTKNFNICSQHWSKERAQFFSMIMSDRPHIAHQCFNSEWIGLWSFASSPIFTWCLVNQLPLFQVSQNFLQGKCFHNQQEEENAFQEFIESWSIDFYATGINELISPGAKYVDCNGSYFG